MDKSTKALKSSDRLAPEIIVYDDPSKRKKSSSPSFAWFGGKKRRDLRQNSAETSFNLDKARHEVRQLGIKGLSNESKEDAIMNKLIQLGAKPPKRKYTNYKELQEIRKKEKNEKEDQNKRKKKAFRGQHIADSSSRLSKKKRKSANTAGVDGQIGRYVRGVQVIGSKDLRQVRSTIASNS